MFIRKRRMADPSKTKVQICESIRDGKKVSQKVLRYIGVATSPEELASMEKAAACIVEEILRERNGGAIFDGSDVLENSSEDDQSTSTKPIKKPSRKRTGTVKIENLKEESRLEEGCQDIFGFAAMQAGLLDCVEESDRELLQHLIAQRISTPTSKRKTHSHLVERVGFDCSLTEIYRFLSRLGAKENVVNTLVFNHRNSLFNKEIDVLFFDVTTLYYESWTQDELRDFGFSKDCKFGQVQVTLALAADSSGFPVGYKLFSGNTAEITTLVECVSEWKKTLAIRDTIFVADRGMLSAKNLWELEQANFKYIVGYPLRKLSLAKSKEVLDGCGYRANIVTAGNTSELHWINSFEHSLSFKRKKADGKFEKKTVEGKLIAGFSSRRAIKDKSDREKMIEKAIKKYESKKGKKASTTELKELVGNKGYSKFLKFDGAANATIEVDRERVAQDAQWDGMHGVFTNTDLDVSEVLSRYRGLWQIEDCFRLQKTNLKIRPVFHYSPIRVRGHIALCFLSLVTLKTVEHKLKKAGVSASPAKISEELSQVGSSIVRDTKKGTRFRLPSKLSELAQKIYDAFGIKRSAKPQIL